MLDVEQAQDVILQASPCSPTRLCRLEELRPEILAQPITADRDLPPFDRVAMDGIAIQHEAWQAGRRDFTIQSSQRAGEAPHQLWSAEYCIEIMTGAVLPQGCNCVVKVEDLILEGSKARITEGLALTAWQNIHAQASDARQGQVLLSAGTRMGPLQWALAAAVGQTRLQVAARPSCVLISTGDEIVEAAEIPLPYQIRGSNLWMLLGALRNFGFEDSAHTHFRDETEALQQGLKQLLQSHEVLILTGGVSMGKYDLIPGVLHSLNVQERVYKIRQRPGKPFWFGIGPQGQRVFGLPGNPLSAAICFYRYVLPSLLKSIGAQKQAEKVRLAHDFKALADLTCFVPVRLYQRGAEWQAEQVVTQGSGDFYALCQSDGFVELAPAKQSWPAETAVQLWRW